MNMDRVDGDAWFTTVWINDFSTAIHLAGLEEGLKIEIPNDAHLNDKDVRMLRLAILRYEKWRKG